MSLEVNLEVQRLLRVAPTQPCHRTSEGMRPKRNQNWTSLVVQWLRIRLPMQGTRV